MIIFPMAGLSQRFFNAGYTVPKYMLPLTHGTVFAYVLRSFEFYFRTEPFLFICRDIQNTPDFINAQCKELGIQNWRIIVLDTTTQGQAETVAMGLKQAALPPDMPLAIFNIDTIRPHFRFPSPAKLQSHDGFLEVFKGKGDAWSFAKTVSSTDMTVTETAEKKRISDFCSTGFYYFNRVADFMAIFDLERSKPKEAWGAPELYVAPLYNYLIQQGKRIFAVEVETSELIPCGTPDEYEDLLASNDTIYDSISDENLDRVS